MVKKITHHLAGVQLSLLEKLLIRNKPHIHIRIQIHIQKIISYHSFEMHFTIDNDLEVVIVDHLQ